MEYKFIQPVSMQVTQEQYERDLREPLLKMGYKEYAINLYKKELDYLITNHSNNNDSLTNLREENIDHNARYFIPNYNPELFLAIAAMTNKESPIIGEWLVPINEMAYAFEGALVKKESPNTTLKWFRRATLQELINKFTNQKEDTMKKELTQELIKDFKNLIAPENVEKFDELMGIEKPMFRKKDFRFGDKVKIRIGDINFIITNWHTEDSSIEEFGLFSKSGAVRASKYNDELCNKTNKLGDIVEIYRPKGNYIPFDLANDCMEDYDLIWSRD